MKKRILSVITAAAIILSLGTVSGPVDAEKSFVEINPGLTPEEALVEARVIEGYPDGELHLENFLTRTEFTKMIVSAFLPNNNEKASISFSDVNDDFWGCDYIKQAVAAGVIKGFEDNTFRPDDKVTYEQAVKIVERMLSGRDYQNYPTDYIKSALDKGIADGMTSVIGESITRKEAVSLIYNALLYSKEYGAAEEEDLQYSYSASYYPKNGTSSGRSEFAPTGIGTSAVEDGYVEYFYEPEYDIDYFNTEEYTENDENVFKSAVTSPLSTFSIDTDTASYSNMRRFALQSGKLPPSGSIRTEELINYFSFDNPDPEDGKPFSVTASMHECPWNENNLLAKIDIQGADEGLGKSNLVFLVDVSGSMYDFNKLPLVKKSLKMLLEELGDTDTVSIVTYASGTQVVLESTPVSEKEKIIASLDAIHAGGGTYGEAGINLAYEQAEKNLIDGNNRIILCTDGDFNIGESSTGDLKNLIEEKREKGIYLTVLGFGMGNYKDSKMETLADYGNGNYAYIDSAREAKKVFVDEMPKTIYTIAKDVKIQVEFNPAKVKEYRLIGYENRVLNNEDFENDEPGGSRFTNPYTSYKDV